MRKLSFVFLFVLFYSCVCTAQKIDTIKVKVHNHEMVLYASGEGKPTIILEAGGSGNHRNWLKVQPAISEFAKVISYDRAGYLKSDSCSLPRDAVIIAKELKIALTNAGIQPPYILAGWSMGGAFVRVFAGLYPKDVVGLLLVDPTPEEFYPRWEKEIPASPEDDAYMKEMLNSKRAGEREEMKMFDTSMNQARRSDKFHSTPTTLLIAAGGKDRDTTDPVARIWIEESEKWGKRRPNLEYEIIRNSGHHIAGQQPDTVVHAIRELINKYQSKKLKQSATSYKKPDQLNDGIQTATLKDAGLNEKIIRSMQDSIIAGVYPNIHSVLILRNDKLVYEKYFPGTDDVRRGPFLGVVDHDRDSIHDIRSVTKSVVGAAFLIATAQEKIKNTGQRVFDFFPEYAKYDTGMKKNITINHLLNMTAGLEWDDGTFERRMNNSPDAIEFVLSQKLVDTPGVKYNYSGGCTQLLASIVEKTTGMKVDKFAMEYLFKPLGIQDFSWVKTTDGNPSAASGLRMRSRDMAKFGLLFINAGKWKDKQIIPSRLVEQTMKSQVATPYSDADYPEVGYSNQFWIYTQMIAGKPVKYFQAQGNGGQLIVMDKKNDLVLIVTAGNYNKSGLRKTSWEIYADFIYPAIIK